MFGLEERWGGSMVYFVSCKDVYEYPVYPTFLEGAEDAAWKRIPFEQPPETLELNAVERESIAKGATAMEHGYRVIGDEAPRKMLWEGGDRDLPEIIQRNCIAVSARFLDLIERFEPGVHQFFPVEIFKARDGQAVATYYWLNICNRIDSVDPERSNVYWKANYAGERGSWRSHAGKPQFVFNLASVANRHLWIDPYLPTHRHFYCSRDFGDAALAANFSGLALTPQEAG